MKFSDFLERANFLIDSVVYPENKSADLFLDKNIVGVSNQSTQSCENMIFVAVKGAKFDGLDFVEQAVQNGAVAIVSDRIIQTGVPVILTSDVRHAMAVMANILYPTPNMCQLAVTGTNGKTSTAYFVRQILNHLNCLTASIGTIGIESPVYNQPSTCTTPDSVSMHRALYELANKGVQATVMEASSHGLHQKRLDGITFKATAFTNLTRDHLDYHQTMADYLDAKMLLFTQRTDKNGLVVVNADTPECETIVSAVQKQGIQVYTYGVNGQELKLLSQKPTVNGQDIVVNVLGQEYALSVNIYGEFQVMNILCAVGLCLGAGLSVEDIMRVLPKLQAPSGRMELIDAVKGSQIFVDYAHTPDALERVLLSLRPHTENRLICLFGCGGNRDTGKRSQMGKIAENLADVVYITDDNPRFEDATLIRQEIKKACPKGIEIAGRIKAIGTAIHSLEEGDVLVLCGKGHETGQTVGSTVYHFNDKAEVLAQTALFKKEILWDSSELSMVFNTPVSSEIKVTGISIDTRTLEPGDMYIALKGEHLDGHQFVEMALDKGAVVCLVDHLIDTVPTTKQIVVSDTMLGLESLARFARMRSEAVFIGITGSSGKTTTKEMLKAVLSEQGRTFATSGNFNNQIGVPLMLARMPLNTEYAVLEMGMNHTGEMTYLSDLVRPNYTLITVIGSAHRAYFKDDGAIAEAKAEIYTYADKSGGTVINKDCPFFDFLSDVAYQYGIRKIISYGSTKNADFEMISCSVCAGQTKIKMKWHGTEYAYQIAFTGKHFALNSLAVLAMTDIVGASVELGMKTLSQIKPTSGRGATEKIRLKNGVEVTLIDDAYNANPMSMKASIQTLGAYRLGRRIAVLGDMLELGEESKKLHISLAQTLIENDIDSVYTVGTEMQALYDVLPKEMQGYATKTVDEMIKILDNSLQVDDTVLIKASNGIGLNKIIHALKGEK